MLIEALTPLTVRLPERDLQLRPGEPVDLPDEQAAKLLAKALGKVRAVLDSDEIPEIVVEPALSCRPVYWESMDGRLHGPAPVQFMARTGVPGRFQFWLCVDEHGRTVWIRDTLLRAKPASRSTSVVGGPHG